MGALIPWLQVTIAGFIYLCFLFFLILLIAKIDLDKIDFISIKEYFPYMAILIVFLSYVVGYSAHLLSQEVYYYFCPELNKSLEEVINVKARVSDKLYNSYCDIYSNLVLFRHLTLSTFLLAIVLLFFRIYKNKKNSHTKYSMIAFIICILGSLLFAFMYWFIIREQFIEVKDSITQTIRVFKYSF